MSDRDDYMGKLGLFTGLQDKYGKDVHLGDTLEFDMKVWGGDEGTNVFVVTFEEGELQIHGSMHDVSEYCKIVKKWNAA